MRKCGFARKTDFLLYLIVVGVAVITFFAQNRNVGFEPGHHGRVSSHTLAIISKASPDNHFVGYTMLFKNSEGKEQYYYFDRYPVFFSVFLHAILSLSHSLATKVYVARQVMNAIFLCTFVVALMLVDKLINSKRLALAAVLVTFSSPLLLYYKDMIHFDQPALLGFVFLLYSIAIYKLDGRRRLLYLAGFISIALGRGYASYAIMILWVMIECLALIKSTRLKLFIRTLRPDPFVVLAIGLIWGAILGAYNVYIEAQATGVPYAQTSIVKSAAKRLLGKDFCEYHARKLGWRNFAPEQIRRVIRLSVPWKSHYIDTLRYLILVLMVTVILIFVKRAEINKRVILLLMIFSGFLWIFAMRSLTAFHKYTAMYCIGIPLLFYMAIFSSVKFLRRYQVYLLLFCTLIFAVSNFRVNGEHSKLAEKVNGYTYDFDRVVQVIAGKRRSIHIQGGYRHLVPGAPYSVGFYLAEHCITPLEGSDYVISTRKKYQSHTFTPSNERVFLFRR